MGNTRLTLEQFITYRNKIIIRLRSRQKHFKSDKPSYYEIRLQELNDQFSQFKNFGLIKTKD